jgi:hypothetical protein
VRAGLTAFLAGVARSVASANVTINFMLPGVFATDRLRTYIDTMAKKKGLSADAALAERVSTVPARRVGQPDEFGATCAFLRSAQAGYISGQNILIDVPRRVLTFFPIRGTQGDRYEACSLWRAGTREARHDRCRGPHPRPVQNRPRYRRRRALADEPQQAAQA